ncbi:uncharacterized protein [Aegilops tauschii subsp. strangulata]|uniref:uncharacterized protein n=1 Tax=Aegilops tauschii subsp. strangulata TaxID=200361 RepID=UPI00098B9293|nr:uncharacterized protein LOC123493779 [Aegilops tauschii subsp. strangulata]
MEAARKEEDGGNRGDDKLPQVVFDRILRRQMVYDALKRGGGAEVPSWVQLLTILLSFGTSALGIAYCSSSQPHRCSNSPQPHRSGSSPQPHRSGSSSPPQFLFPQLLLLEQLLRR